MRLILSPQYLFFLCPCLNRSTRRRVGFVFGSDLDLVLLYCCSYDHLDGYNGANDLEKRSMHPVAVWIQAY